MSENNQNEVRKEPHVMSRDDVNDYDGLTLNEQGEQEERRYLTLLTVSSTMAIHEYESYIYG